MELWVIPGNEVGGCQMSWVVTGYELSQRWVMTESTVVYQGAAPGGFRNTDHPSTVPSDAAGVLVRVVYIRKVPLG